MLFDRTEHEPEEYDPEEEFRDPDSDSLTIPDVSRETEESNVESPSVPVPTISTEETDVPAPLLKHFWALVLVLNAVILAAALGLLFLYFEGSTSRSLALFAAAVVLSGFAYRRYRAYRELDIDELRSDAAESRTDTETTAHDGSKSTGESKGDRDDPEADPDDEPSDPSADPSTTSGETGETAADDAEDTA